jgi:isoleucyl-tRNA synthetase
LRDFADVMTNWYVRRSRDRFWDVSTEAFDTLYTVLVTLTKVAAPLLPMLAEEIHTGLTGERSVHLTDWPEAGIVPADPDLVAAMDQVREACSAASSLRKAKKLRVRLPLTKLTVAVDNPQQLEPFAGLIADELNVKAVELTDDIAAHGRFELTVNARAAGPRLGKSVQDAIKAVKSPEEIALIRRMTAMQDIAAEAVTKALRPGLHLRKGSAGGMAASHWTPARHFLI